MYINKYSIFCQLILWKKYLFIYLQLKQFTLETSIVFTYVINWGLGSPRSEFWFVTSVYFFSSSCQPKQSPDVYFSCVTLKKLRHFEKLNS
jgi:hypothetical protein